MADGECFPSWSCEITLCCCEVNESVCRGGLSISPCGPYRRAGCSSSSWPRRPSIPEGERESTAAATRRGSGPGASPPGESSGGASRVAPRRPPLSSARRWRRTAARTARSGTEGDLRHPDPHDPTWDRQITTGQVRSTPRLGHAAGTAGGDTGPRGHGTMTATSVVGQGRAITLGQRMTVWEYLAWLDLTCPLVRSKAHASR